jgi:hypothetical protein
MDLERTVAKLLAQGDALRKRYERLKERLATRAKVYGLLE